MKNKNMQNEQELIVCVYTYEDGTTVEISDNSYSGRTDSEIERAKDIFEIECVNIYKASKKVE